MCKKLAIVKTVSKSYDTCNSRIPKPTIPTTDVNVGLSELSELSVWVYYSLRLWVT